MKEYISWNVIRAGQARPYADSIFEYELESNVHEGFVKRFCTEVLHPSKNEGGTTFNGSCDFPFGLSSYYNFKRTGDNVFRYIVCEPFCD